MSRLSVKRWSEERGWWIEQNEEILGNPLPLRYFALPGAPFRGGCCLLSLPTLPVSRRRVGFKHYFQGRKMVSSFSYLLAVGPSRKRREVQFSCDPALRSWAACGEEILRTKIHRRLGPFSWCLPSLVFPWVAFLWVPHERIIADDRKRYSFGRKCQDQAVSCCSLGAL